MTEIDTNSVRKQIFEAGERLLVASQRDFSALAAADVAREAGIGEQDFNAAFQDISQFWRELLRHMMDVVRAEVLAAAAGFGRPGFERMWRTVEAFLDANLRHPVMRRLAHEMRTDPVAIELLRQRMAGYAMVFKTELAALERPNPAGAARLATAMIVEAAKAEHEAGRAHAEVRRALYAFLKGYSA